MCSTQYHSTPVTSHVMCPVKINFASHSFLQLYFRVTTGLGRSKLRGL